jgi:uncharacterized protein YodC (DUF2158 family)
MDKQEFKIGDIVVLNSDSGSSFPILMTVNKIEMGTVTCVWAVSSEHDFHERSFSAEALKLYSNR